MKNLKKLYLIERTLAVFLCLLIFFVSNAQVQKNSLFGKVIDSDSNILPGASVVIVGTNYGVNANEAGEYRFNQISAGKLKIQASFVGFKTIIVDFNIQPGQNYLDLSLDFTDIKLDGVTVLAQKREQQI
jgi:iron complex outermembrane receptor protein